MSKKIIKIDLEGTIIGSKPLLLNDSLTIVRDKIKEKAKIPFLFLDQEGNDISKDDENDYSLTDIIVGNIIKIKPSKINESKIKVILNENLVSDIKCEKDLSLEDLRKLILNIVKEEFIFLDMDGNKVEKEDEQDYKIEDILVNESIKIIPNQLQNTFKEAPPANPANESSENNHKIFNEDKTTNSKNKNIDFSKYDIINKRNDLTTYKYSNIMPISKHELVREYLYDKNDEMNYNDSDAYVILFCGKTGDGKSTAINAFFNIIKGIELEDNYRFILVTEPKKAKGQAESQTDGVHLYYLKDKDNKPVIIIDSQGYGDTRGKKYDEMVNDAFRYVFTNVIDHINTVCFIAKSNTNRLDILTRYIFSSVTNLFSEDISENFIILATFANIETMEDGPAFISSIQTDADFLNIQKRMNENWWYALDSKCILRNEKDSLTKYSFKQLNELYENKVKKLRPKSIKKCAEVLETRNELKMQINSLNITFQNLIVEQENLQKKQDNLNKKQFEIRDLENKIERLNIDIDKCSPEEQKRRLELLNEELNNNLAHLQRQTEQKTVKNLVPTSTKCTHCDYCKNNCHAECDCWFSCFGRCKKFTMKGKCQSCSHSKSSHNQDYYHYIYETIQVKKNTDDEQRIEKEKIEQKKKIEEEEIKKKNDDKSMIEFEKEKLNYNIKGLLDEKKRIEKEQKEIHEKIENIKKQILFIIIKLQTLSEKINVIAMNNNHTKTEDEYIDSLKDNMNGIGYKDDEQINKLNEIKKNNKILRESMKLDKEELMKLDDSQLADKLKVLIPS